MQQFAHKYVIACEDLLNGLYCTKMESSANQPKVVHVNTIYPIKYKHALSTIVCDPVILKLYVYLFLLQVLVLYIFAGS